MITCCGCVIIIFGAFQESSYSQILINVTNWSESDSFTSSGLHRADTQTVSGSEPPHVLPEEEKHTGLWKWPIGVLHMYDASSFTTAAAAAAAFEQTLVL